MMILAIGGYADGQRIDVRSNILVGEISVVFEQPRVDFTRPIEEAYPPTAMVTEHLYVCDILRFSDTASWLTYLRPKDWTHERAIRHLFDRYKGPTP